MLQGIVNYTEIIACLGSVSDCPQPFLFTAFQMLSYEISQSTNTTIITKGSHLPSTLLWRRQSVLAEPAR